MKKFGLITFAGALLIGSAFSQGCSFSKKDPNSGIQGSGNSKSETRNLRDFKKIEADDAVTIEVTTQPSYAVEVTADDNLLAAVKTEVKGDTLKIYTENKTSSKAKFLIKISLPQIESLDVSGASTADVSNVRADSLDIKASGASKVKIDGQTAKLKAEASGASTLDAEGLKTVDAKVEASGASQAMVFASGKLDANASGASSITYSGDPQDFKQDSSGASSIIKR